MATIDSPARLRTFNEVGGIAVDLDVMRATVPALEISGSQSETLSFWETRSASGFVTKPKFSAKLVTIRFMTSGHMVYSCRHGDTIASTMSATLVGFDELDEVRAPGPMGALSVTFSVQALEAAYALLTGDEIPGLPTLAPIADMAVPGVRALFCTVQLIHSRNQLPDQRGDLVTPLLQEVLSYQLLSSWPKRDYPVDQKPLDVASQKLRLAIDYIEANLLTDMTLADVAGAARIGVRVLQLKFRKELGRTPLQFIIERRLARAHESLLSVTKSNWSVADIARSCGFVHISDFGQRYRRLYGCTPSQTRRATNRER